MVRIKKILFVCKYNRFRSQVAEALFNKYNKSNKIKASSAGLIKGIPVADSVKKAAKKYGFSVGKPKNISEKDLVNTDLVIIVSEGIPDSLFKRQGIMKVIKWGVEDVDAKDTKGIERIIGLIREKVLNLVSRL